MSKKELNVNNNRNFNNKYISFILQRIKYNHVYEVHWSCNKSYSIP